MGAQAGLRLAIPRREPFLVDDAPSHATVHTEGEVLHDTQQLYIVVFAVV